MTATASVFFEKSTHDEFILEFCCDGRHVYERHHSMWGIQEYAVSSCDGSCKEKPAVRQKDFSEEETNQLRRRPMGYHWTPKS